MRQATTVGDEVCIAMFIHCLKLSTTVLNVIQDDRDGTGCILLDVCAVGSPHTDTPVPLVLTTAFGAEVAASGATMGCSSAIDGAGALTTVSESLARWTRLPKNSLRPCDAVARFLGIREM